MRNIAIPYPIKAYQNYTFVNTTLGALVDTFSAANASARAVPRPSSPLLGKMTTSYNLAIWAGNTTAYMKCDLEDRGKDYLGECVAMNVTCTASTNDTVPYTCVDLTSATPNTTIPGSLSTPSYRANCETPCDRRLDCNAICECWGTCGGTEYCECDACVALNVNAAADTQFVDIRTIVTDQAAASASIADVTLAAGHRRRRSLLTTNEELATQLSSVLTQVGTVSTQQTSIATQMTTLKAQVDRANQLAEARANDNRLIDLINAGRADIQAGQVRAAQGVAE
jgi:hypothetical protein